MVKHSEDKRKNFRFPAFDDDEGVKLTTSGKRKLFEDDEILGTRSNNFFEAENMYQNNKTLYKNKKVTESMEKPVTEVIKYQEIPVKRNWEKPKTKEPVEEKKPIFHSEYKPIFSKSQEEPVKRSKNNRFGTGSYQSSVKKYEPPKQFVPSRVPTSLVPKKEAEEPKLNSELIREKMKKSNASYLLMDLDEEQATDKQEHKIFKTQNGREERTSHAKDNLKKSHEKNDKGIPFVNKKYTQE